MAYLVTNKDTSIPRQLPDEDKVVDKLCRALNYKMWIDEGLPTHLIWVLSQEYSTYDLGDTHPLDRARVNLLLQAASRVGLKLYFATLSREEKGLAQGWIDRDDPENDAHVHLYGGWNPRPPSVEDRADVDADGFHIIEYESVSGAVTTTTTKLSRWHDIVADQKVEGIESYHNDGETFLPKDWKDCAPDVEDYDDSEGALSHSWTRTVVVLWPGDMGAQAAIEIHDKEALSFLDARLWPKTDTGRQQRTDFLNDFIEFQLIEDDQKPAEKTCCDVALDFALELDRPDIFAEILRKSGMCELDAILKASEKFSGKETPSVLRDVVVTRVRKESDISKRLDLLSAVFQKDSEGFSEALDKALTYDQTMPTLPLTVECLDRFREKFGVELLVSWIFPSLKNHDNTFWTFLLDYLPSNSYPSEYLTRVATWHNPGYSPDGSVRNTTVSLLRLCLRNKKLHLARHILVSLAQLPIISSTSTKKIDTALNTIKQVIDAVNLHDIPLTEFYIFFQRMVLAHVLLPLGRCPSESEDPDYALPPIAVDHKNDAQRGTVENCSVCLKLNEFLTSTSLLKGTLGFNGTDRKHARALVNARVLQKAEITREVRGMNGSISLAKTGVELSDRVQAWNDLRDRIREVLEGLDYDNVLPDWKKEVSEAISPSGTGWPHVMEEVAGSWVQSWDMIEDWSIMLQRAEVKPLWEVKDKLTAPAAGERKRKRV